MLPNHFSRRRVLALLSLPLGTVLLGVQRSNAAELICTDANLLDAAAKAQRTAQHYVDVSPLGEKKNCANCAIFQTGAPNACGSCVAVPGPIRPLGYCDAWTDMA